MAIKAPPLSGVIGNPNPKEGGNRVDFRQARTAFAQLVESKGYRIAWARACHCPCRSAERQSTQADPNCQMCGGDGYFYFRAKDYAPPEAVGELDNLQKSLLAKYRAVVIRGMITSVARNVTAYDKLGDWMFGTAMCTVRPENRLGHYDRIVMLDSVVANDQIVDVVDPELPIPVRWPVIDVNLLLDENGNRYVQGSDFELTDDGQILFISGREGPPARYAVHFHYHPVWLVMEHAHVVRETLVKQKTQKPQTPAGDTVTLPIQAIIRLDYLALEDRGAEV